MEIIEVVSMNPQIYLITSMYPYAPDKGGIQTHSYYLYNYLIKSNYEVFVFTVSDEHYIDEPRIFPFSSNTLSDAIKASRDIMKVLASHKPGVIHVHFNRELVAVAYLINAHNPAPMIASFHDDPYFVENEPINNPIIERFLLDTIKKMELIIVHSEYVAKGVRDSFSLPENKLKIIPLGIDIQKFRRRIPSDIKRFNFIKDDHINVLCPARYSPQKGLIKFINNIHKIKDKIMEYHFILLGEGPQKNKLEAEIARLDLRDIVELADSNVSYDSMPDVYNAVDVVILPSLYEPVGIVLMEAMACEKPVIASKVGGIPEIIEHMETGILFDPENPTELATYLNFLSDGSLRGNLGKKGRNRVTDHFNIDNTIKDFIDTYNYIYDLKQGRG